jgi:hypothetical protein
MTFIKTTGTNVNLDTSEFVGGSGLLDTTTDTVQKALAAINVALDLVNHNFDGIMSSQDKIKLDTIESGSQPNVVLSVAGKIGNVVLNNNDVSGVAPIVSPTFTGTPAVEGQGNILTETSNINGGYF